MDELYHSSSRFARYSSIWSDFSKAAIHRFRNGKSLYLRTIIVIAGVHQRLDSDLRSAISFQLPAFGFNQTKPIAIS